MSRILRFKLCQIKVGILFFLIGFVGHAQVIQVEIIGGAVVVQGSTVTINAGSNLQFRVTNVENGNCNNLEIQDINISNTSDFDISPNNPKDKIKPNSCRGDHNLDFEIENTSSSCSSTSTLVTIKIKNQSDFTFTLVVNSSPVIYVLGGSPWADINHGDTSTSDKNGTYFGVVDEGDTVTRYFIVANIGSCILNVSALGSSNSDFAVFGPYGIPVDLPSYYYTVIGVTFTAPVAGIGTQRSTISITNTDNGTFNFDVTAEMFDYSIPGPGGITADFRLWLKATRGVIESSSKVSLWEDLGTNGKDAQQLVLANQPTYLDTTTDNINFNPVIKFENDGVTLEQYLENTTNGFYSQDIFVVMKPEVTMTNASSINTIFGGISTGGTGDITGVGYGNYSSEFTDETLSYNQNIPGGGSYNGTAELNTSYSNAGIINVRNNATLTNGQDILYNSNVLSTSKVNNITYANVNAGAGSKYWIGRNFDVQGSLNGRVAEIFTFASRVTDANRQKIESYLAIKYGITLGASNEATKDYINSFNTKVWDVSANAGYNYDVAGIGKDSISDLNQKQSKTINSTNGVTIGLGGLFTTNSVNPNELSHDGDFLVWGNNNGALSGTNTNLVTIASGITTSLTRMDRKWKVVESEEVISSDVETVFVGIPTTAFSGFTKAADEEYALIVADNEAFTDADIIDVIPLKINVDPTTGIPILDSNGNQVYKTWYDFHETKYFTFGKVSKLSEKHAVSIASGDYLVGESDLNLSVDSFTISAWVKTTHTASTRTLMAKGNKLQIRLNSADKVEVMIDDVVIPKYTSDMVINDGKWHQLTFVYDSASIFLYVDGVLDHSVQDVVHPSPNYNHFSIGAVYVDKDNILNPFLGDIDEVYVWDLALDENQIRFLMNQEIEKAAGNFVSGKEIPTGSSSNPVSTIPWSSLRVYYDFNSFYGSTVEGLTDNRFFLRLKYLNKDKTLLDTQSIPVDYVSIADGDWDDPATWSNSADNVLPNALSLDGVTYIDWNIVEINHNITSGDKDITVLALKINSGKLTIADPITTIPVENNDGQALTITHYLEFDGVIDLVGESQLIQTEGSIVDADSGGYIERDQQGTANGFNYNYWSSSVGPIPIGGIGTSGTGIAATNDNYTLLGVLKNGTDSEVYAPLNFDASPSGGTTPPPGLERTISTYWTYKFYGPASDYYSWEKINKSSSISPGEGFTMKGTSGAVPISDKQNYVFVGLPNNGDITLSLDKTSGDVDRLIGNPYPSAIDATEFILDNLGIADGGNNINGNIINGALYFWDHFGEENSHVLKEYVGGYATRNLTGGAVAISNDARINNTSDAGSPATGSKEPGQFIPVNQGFFVSTALDGFNNNNDPIAPITTVVGGDIVFKNSQRVFAREDGSTSLFLKSTKNKGSKGIVKTNKTEGKSVIKLMYDSPEGYHRQIVIGANKNASLGFDIGYDAYMADVNKEDMYWILNNSKFVIQGVNNFNDDQEFPIGLIVNKAGVIKIKLDHLENIDTSKSLYIKDNITEETYSINETPFEIYLDSGTYNDRFKLVFQPTQKTLDVDVLTLENNLITYYEHQNSNLTIILKSDIMVNKGLVLTILGQELQVIGAFSNRISIPLKVSKGAYIIQLETDKGRINKKIIIK